ncbi:hypothetical protein LTR46_011693 [Exophiala xenobiotica]|nr:hypothetical protein LTR46_011693 [Exophiala xenobiotica]
MALHPLHPPPAGHVTTTVLINNVHCASCLSYIHKVLSTLQPAPLTITANYISHEVTIVHFPDHSATDIARALSDAAFEVQSVQTEDESGHIIYEQDLVQTDQEWLEQAAQMLSEQASTLSRYQTAAHHEFRDDPGYQLDEKHLDHCVLCQKANEKAETSQDVIVNIPEAQKFTATLSITGMTCAACILSINEGLQGLQFLTDVSVSLLTNSATVSFTGPKDNIDQIVERIEDRGYDCHVESIVGVGQLQQTKQLVERTTMIRIAGMFCDQCPRRVIDALSSPFQGRLAIDKPPSYDDPIIFPRLTAYEIFFQQNMWTGADTRAEWALFFLATPVMFLAADVFHIRAIKEIRALWSRNSKVPVLRRFYRFGSMNLLMSAGTSVAYFPSIAVLALESQKTGQHNRRQSTYFDAVVFLTMFILAGRYLEAYSKSKAGDAVTMLGKLRPTEALLVRSNPETEKSELSLPITNCGRINVNVLEVGDVVRVLYGVSPPADGTIVLRDSTFDESSLTGESRPITKNTGDQVFAGTINTGKPINVRVTEVSGASMLDQIVKVVREGQAKRAPVERVADILTGYFVQLLPSLPYQHLLSGLH